MCGLVGVAGNITLQHENILRDMYLLNATRGFDSCGIFTVHEDTVVIEKSLGTFPELFGGKIFNEKGFIKGPVTIAACHNRAATVGAVSIDNAHPFEKNNIIGMHNGTVSKWEMKVLGEIDDHKTDSENIFKHVDESGIHKVWSSVDGAMALVFYDKDKKTLNFIRNNHRPLHYYQKWNLLFWSSDPSILYNSCIRHGMDFFYEDVKEVPVNQLLSFVIEKKGVTLVSQNTLKVPKPNIYPMHARNIFKGLWEKAENSSVWDNTKWSLKTIVGEKTTRGVIIDVTRSWGHTYYSKYWVGNVLDNERVEIFFRTQDIFDKFKQLVQGSNSTFQLLTTSKMRWSSQLKTYRIDFNNTKWHPEDRCNSEIKNVNRVKELLVESDKIAPEILDDWIKRTDKLKGQCPSCSEGFIWGVNDSDMVWLGQDSYLCKDCAKDETLTEVARSL